MDAERSPDYPWPGNVRELEQCVRNLVIRGTYEPQGPPPGDARAEFLAAVEAGALGADALLRRYCTWVYALTGSYSETARRLGLDPRTASRVARRDPGRARGSEPRRSVTGSVGHEPVADTGPRATGARALGRNGGRP